MQLQNVMQYVVKKAVKLLTLENHRKPPAAFSLITIYIMFLSSLILFRGAEVSVDVHNYSTSAKQGVYILIREALYCKDYTSSDVERKPLWEISVEVHRCWKVMWWLDPKLGSSVQLGMMG